MTYRIINLPFNKGQMGILKQVKQICFRMRYAQALQERSLDCILVPFHALFLLAKRWNSLYETGRKRVFSWLAESMKNWPRTVNNTTNQHNNYS